MPRLSQLVDRTAWNAAGKLAQFAINLVALALIARIVGPDAYGVIALSWVFIGLTDIFLTASPSETLVQRKTVRTGHLNASFVLPLVLGLLAWAALAAGAAPAAALLNGGPDLEAVLPWRGASIVLAALLVVPTALLMRAGGYRALAGAESIAAVAASVTGIALALAGAGIWSLVAMEIVRGIVHAALAFTAARWRPGWRFGTGDVRDLAGYNINTWGSYGLGYLEQQLPRIIIGRMLGTEGVGLFALAQRLFTEATRVLTLPVYQVLIAGISRVREDRAALRSITAGALRATTLVAAPLFIGLAACAQVLIPLFFGDGWIAAVPVAEALLLLGLRHATGNLQAAVLRGGGYAHWQLLLAAIGIALTLVLVGLAAPFGVALVGLAMLARGYLVWPVAAPMIRAMSGLSLRTQAFAGVVPTLAALVMGVAVWLFLPFAAEAWPQPVALAAGVVVGVAIYITMLRLLSPALFRQLVGIGSAIARRDRDALRLAFDGA
ncbi:MAG: oligosaccharide flippase family protein [Burkholderiaceae bacterium]|nr:oligosaccharide flippase family protein [Burkholderiaceae bacterium]